MTPGPSQPLTSPCISQIGLMEAIATIYYNSCDGAIHAYLFTCTTYLHLCFIKIMVLAPSGVCFFTIAIYLCICVFLLINAMHAYVYCVARGSEDTVHYC